MLIAIDYETCDSRGASFEYFRKDFRVFSLSCAWREDGQVKHWFSVDPVKICTKLADLARFGHKIVAHNLPYEMGVTNAVYPRIKLNWYADTMRLSQVRDGGGDEFNPPELTLEQSIALELGEINDKEASKMRYGAIGLSLEACAQRFLTDASLHSHKKPAHDWLKEHCGIKSGFGRELHRLPHDMLEQYNNADTLVTLLLYEEHIRWAADQKYGWERDHELYLMRGHLMTGAYQRGIVIDSAKLLKYILSIEKEIADIEAQFMTFYQMHEDAMQDFRFARVAAWATDGRLKSDRARYNRWVKILQGKTDVRWRTINIGSSAQLQVLFTHVLNMVPKFLTKKGSPSFKTVHLNQWGPGGQILEKRRKRLLVLQQCVNTYVASMYDGRVHCSVKVSGTRTNRVASGRM